MKSIDLESVQISQEHGVWATTYGPTRKLTEAFKNKQNNIYLIFSVNESGGYQGYARMMGKPDPKLKPHIFCRDDSSIPYEDNFPVKWETKLMQF